MAAGDGVLRPPRTRRSCSSTSTLSRVTPSRAKLSKVTALILTGPRPVIADAPMFVGTGVMRRRAFLSERANGWMVTTGNGSTLASSSRRLSGSGSKAWIADGLAKAAQ